jgi:hypothetical protein
MKPNFILNYFYKIKDLPAFDPRRAPPPFTPVEVSFFKLKIHQNRFGM